MTLRRGNNCHDSVEIKMIKLLENQINTIKSGRESDINNKMQVIVERNAESNDRQTEKTRKFRKFQKRGAHVVFLQHSTLTRHLNLADHKLVCCETDLSVSKRTLIYARKKNTPQSTMMLLNCINCMVSEYLPLSKFKSLIVLLV